MYWRGSFYAGAIVVFQTFAANVQLVKVSLVALFLCYRLDTMIPWESHVWLVSHCVFT